MEFHYSYSSSSFPFGMGGLSIGGYLPAFLVVQVFFALTLRNLLLQCDPANRKVNPDYVWFNLIPLFNLIWPFILNPKVCASVRAEFAKRGIHEAGDFGHTLGILYPILLITLIIPIIGLLGVLASMILFILFWVKMAHFKRVLSPPPAPPTLPPPTPHNQPPNQPHNLKS